MDSFLFLNWDEEELSSIYEKAVVFLSLVATLKLNPALDESLEAKAVKFLITVFPPYSSSADAFLNSIGRTTDESLTNFIQSIVVLLSTSSQAITTTAMEMLARLISNCSKRIRLALIKANLITQIINTLNPQSLSFTEAAYIHTRLISTIAYSFYLATPYAISALKIEDDDEQQAVHETILKQVLTPSEKYIWHLCVNRFSVIDGSQSYEFMRLLTWLIDISPYYQPTMEVVLNMPVFLTIPSCLTFFERDSSIWSFLDAMVYIQQRWNGRDGEPRLMGKNMDRMLRMEGVEDMIEEKLQNDKSPPYGRDIVAKSMMWNNFLGMNVPELW